MIIWTDNAFIIGTTPLSERDLLVECFSEQHGRFKAVAKFGATSKNKTKYQEGNFISCEWKAKQEHQLGTITVEVLKGHMALIISDYLRLLSMQSVHSLIRAYLYQHDKASKLFFACQKFYEALILHDVRTLLLDYANLELILLEETGYGLSLHECVVTGDSDNLHYISPRSGCAVNINAGEPYKDKLFIYPKWLKDANYQPSFAELLDGLRMNAYFLERRLGEVHHAPLPVVRTRLLQQCENLAANE